MFDGETRLEDLGVLTAARLKSAFQRNPIFEKPDGLHDLDTIRCIELFCNKHWSDVDFQAVIKADYCFSYLDQHLLFSYLPSFLMAAIVKRNDPKFYDLVDRLVDVLEPGEWFFDNYLATLNKVQKAAISEWTKWLISETDGIYRDWGEAIILALG